MKKCSSIFVTVTKNEGLELISSHASKLIHSYLLGKPLSINREITIGSCGIQLVITITTVYPKGLAVGVFTLGLYSELLIEQPKSHPMENVLENIESSIANDALELKELFSAVLFNMNESSGFSGIIIEGPPGTGKTRAARLLKSTLRHYFPSVSVLMAKKYVLRSLIESFEQVISQAKLKHEGKTWEEIILSTFSIVLVDELDTHCPESSNRDLNESTRAFLDFFHSNVHGWLFSEEAEHGITLLCTKFSISRSILLAALKDQILPIGCTNHLFDVDKRLLQPTFFEKQIAFNLPDGIQKEKIIKSIFSEVDSKMPVEKTVSLISSLTPGFSNAELYEVIRILHQPKTSLAELTDKHIYAAIKRFGLPSVQKEYGFLKVSRFEEKKEPWGDISGYEDVKQLLTTNLLWQLDEHYKKKMKHFGLSKPKGILIYGPPGCGKTNLALSIAKQANFGFLKVDISDILSSSYFGDAEKVVRKVFRQAKLSSPCIVFIDEIDSLTENRSFSESSGSNVKARILTTFLTELDGVDETSSGIIVLGATNHIQDIDKALLRSGRFDLKIFIGLPDKVARKALLQRYLLSMKLDEGLQQDIFSGGDVMQELVKRTHNFSGAEIKEKCQQTGLLAVRLSRKQIGEKELLSVFKC
eukprot:snap_masked-scaffold_9-processed-gene-1.21-mRNA-1 protein AED:0.31 eAED:0.33 QI:0/-1/0/1/-1/1/1/0/643